MTLINNNKNVLKKIYVCGDSFSTVDARYPGFHWSEKLGVLLGDNYKVINLAFMGASYLCIYMQVQKVLQNNDAAFVIVNGTSFGRLDLATSHGVKLTDGPLLEQMARIPCDETLETFTDRIISDRRSVGGTFYTMNSFAVSNDTSRENPQRTAALRLYYLELFNYEIAAIKDIALIDLMFRVIRDKSVRFVFNGNQEDAVITKHGICPEEERSAMCLSSFPIINRAPVGIPDPIFHTRYEQDHKDIANAYYRILTDKGI
jgi:hypothetical protein